MKQDNEKIMLKHLSNNQKVLLEYSKLISVANHPVNLGTAREALISNFFTQNLPSLIQYHTGEIFDSENNRSGQVDIILHPITSPKLNLFGAINLFPAETVLAAIEVKSTINNISFVDAFRTGIKVKELQLRSGYKTPGVKENIPFVIFGFKSPKISTFINYLKKFENEYIYHLSDKSIENLEKGIKSNALNTLKKMALHKYYGLEEFKKTLTEKLKKTKITEITEIIEKSEKQKIHFGYFPDLIVFLEENYYFKKHEPWQNIHQFDDLYTTKYAINEEEIKILKNEIKLKDDVDNGLFDRIKNNKILSNGEIKILSEKFSIPKNIDLFFDKIEKPIILFELFSFLNTQIENWQANMQDHFFPADYYEKNMFKNDLF